MTGAVTSKYENEYTVKHRTSSFSYKVPQQVKNYPKSFCLAGSGEEK